MNLLNYIGFTWAFLFGLIIGIVIGQITAVKSLLDRIKGFLQDKE